VTRASTFPSTRSFAGRSADVPSERTRQAIPVVAQRTIDLFALFDAALIVKPWSLVLTDPADADALRAWGQSRGLPVRDVHWNVDGREPYASLKVSLDGGRGAREIVAQSYRTLTTEEAAAAKAAQVDRSSPAERVGTVEVAL